MCRLLTLFFFKQKTAYEMRISDWSSDVCSSDLTAPPCGRWGWSAISPSCRPSVRRKPAPPYTRCAICPAPGPYLSLRLAADFATDKGRRNNAKAIMTNPRAHAQDSKIATPHRIRAKIKRSEEHTSELQSLMRNSYD